MGKAQNRVFSSGKGDERYRERDGWMGKRRIGYRKGEGWMERGEGEEEDRG